MEEAVDLLERLTSEERTVALQKWQEPKRILINQTRDNKIHSPDVPIDAQTMQLNANEIEIVDDISTMKSERDEHLVQSGVDITQDENTGSLPATSLRADEGQKVTKMPGMAKLSKEDRLKCDVCDKVLSTASNLKVHKRVHAEVRPFACSLCGKAFSIRPNMLRHERQHSGVKPWQCSQCCKCFTEKKSLAIHVRTHTGEKPFKCEYCGRRFAQAGTLQGHVHIHTGWKGYLCDYCGRAFRQTTQLRLHRLRHVNSPAHKCADCSRSFFSKAELDRHSVLHTGERAFLCSHCPSRFTRLCYLNSHLNLHTGDRPHQCDHCPEAFHDRKAHNRHVKQQHSTPPPPAKASPDILYIYVDTSDNMCQLSEPSDQTGLALIETLLQGQLPAVQMFEQPAEGVTQQSTQPLCEVMADGGIMVVSEDIEVITKESV